MKYIVTGLNKIHILETEEETEEFKKKIFETLTVKNLKSIKVHSIKETIDGLNFFSEPIIK